MTKCELADVLLSSSGDGAIEIMLNCPEEADEESMQADGCRFYTVEFSRADVLKMLNDIDSVSDSVVIGK